MRVLISGAGIAGPTLAFWLMRFGFTPTLVEQAPRLRTGGYVIDFWGTGYDVAERMGIGLDLGRAGYRVKEIRLVDEHGRRAGGMPVSVFRTITRDRYLSLPRGDLAATIYRNLQDSVETLFGDTITAIEETGTGVHVSFENAADREFDILIGADGLHSNVRALAFGPQAAFEKPLGYSVAAFEAYGYRPRDELVYVSYTRPGRQVARFAMRDDRTLFLFVYRSNAADQVDPHDIAAHRQALHAQFGGMGWECAPILEAMDAATDLYVDRVSQIRMDTWSKGRVALLGDAAYCPSLLAGQGSALAMTGAYVLAGELGNAGGDHEAAFRRYETQLRPFMAGKQKAAEGFASAFAPGTAPGVWFRNKVTSLMGVPFLAKALMGRSLADTFDLPDYTEPGPGLT